MSMRVYAYRSIRTYACMCIRMYAHMYTRTCICMYIYTSYMNIYMYGSVPKQGLCNRARAHSRYIPRYIGYVSKGAFCDNPRPSNVVPRHCSKKPRTPEQELLDLDMWSCGSSA